MITKRSIRVPIVKSYMVTEARIAMVIGGLVALLFSLSLCGCRDMPNTATALDVVSKGLVAVDVAADITVSELDHLRQARLAECQAKELPTPEAREDCLGPWAEPLAPKAEAFGKAYDAALDALQALEEAIEGLEELKRQ